MGLDTTHDCWHGPYSAFARFRDEVAAAAKEHYDYVPNYEGHPMRAFLGWWDNGWSGARERGDVHEYDNVLDVFFVHSDCDGYIFPTNATDLADRLEPLVGYLSADGPEGYDQYSSRSRLKAFIDGLRRAADEWEVVRFH